jgi:tetratricopeptide (TPR) repeat protein
MRSALETALLMLGLALWSELALASAPTYSADGLYNLANSYAKAGKPGLAVLNYERASLLAPNDPDIEANLNYVRTAVGLPAESDSRLERFAKGVNPTLAAWLGVLGVVLAGGALLAWRILSGFRSVWIGAALLGVGLIGLTVFNAVELWPQVHEAVVLVSQAPARVSPVPMGDTAFMLKEAETVSMVAEHEDFVLVRTRTGRSGWVARANVGSVMP